MSRSVVSLFLALGLASCGGGGSSTTETTQTTETTTGAETVAWADMNMEQRGHFMATVVMPEMQTMFQEHDAEEFADFSCATCHGANAQEVSFRMPNGLAPLHGADIPAMFGSQDPMHVFMTQRVWPRMGQLLGEELYNPETHQGFACMNCHANADAPVASAE